MWTPCGPEVLRDLLEGRIAVVLVEAVTVRAVDGGEYQQVAGRMPSRNAGALMRHVSSSVFLEHPTSAPQRGKRNGKPILRRDVGITGETVGVALGGVGRRLQEAANDLALRLG